MGKRGQITLFVIIGLVLVLVLGMVVFFMSQKDKGAIKNEPNIEANFNLKKEAFQKYFEQCSRDAIIKANEEFGINEENTAEYESFVSSRVKNCVAKMLDEVRKSGIPVEEGVVSTKVEFYDDIISVDIDYKIEIIAEDIKFNFDSYKMSFPRANFISIINMDNQEIMLPSTDGRARIIIPKNTNVIDETGNEITSLSIKLIDRHFDNLENNVVVGNLVYEGLPDGATFSNLVEISIDFRTKDYPYNVNEDMLSIAWWDENLEIWKGLETKIENGRVIAETTHFTKFAVVIGCNGNEENSIIVRTPYLFKQKYSLVYPAYTESGGTIDDYNQWVSEITSEFCSNSADKYWIKDGETYIPTLDEFKKIKERNPERMEFSVQELFGEKYTYGKEDSKCEEEAEVTPYCCCKEKNGLIEECASEVKGLQECMDLYMEDYKVYSQQSQNALCPVGDYSNTLKRRIFGYNKRECIGGKVENGNTDPGILALKFLPKGNACVFSVNPTEVIYEYNGLPDTAGNCKAEPLVPKESVDSAGNYILEITKLEIDAPTDSFCANCRAAITVKGIGLQETYETYTECQQGDKFEQTYVDNALVCRECVPLEGFGNIYVAKGDNGDQNSDECRCTRSLVGTAWCEDFKKCDLVDDKPTLIDWTNVDETSLCEICKDPISKETFPQCGIVVYTNEVRVE